MLLFFYYRSSLNLKFPELYIHKLEEWQVSVFFSSCKQILANFIYKTKDSSELRILLNQLRDWLKATVIFKLDDAIVYDEISTRWICEKICDAENTRFFYKILGEGVKSKNLLNLAKISVFLVSYSVFYYFW